MKLYRIGYTAPASGANHVAWEGTQADAKRKQRELERGYGRHNVDDVAVVEVPTDKAGLINWLNGTQAGA